MTKITDDQQAAQKTLLFLPGQPHPASNRPIPCWCCACDDTLARGNEYAAVGASFNAEAAASS